MPHRHAESVTRRHFLKRSLATGIAIGGLTGCAATPASVGAPQAARTQPRPRLIDTPPAPHPNRSIPDLGDERVQRFTAGVRPVRRHGVRLAVDRGDSDTPVVHNYGHGGAGITLSWGSAEEAADLIETVANRGSEVVVLGAGIIGLTSAVILRERGYGVRVMADQLPPHTTSNVAGGQFAPSLVGRGRTTREKQRFTRMLRRSHLRLSRIAGWEWGVSEIDNFTTGSGSGLSLIPEGLFAKPVKLDRLPFAGVERSGYLYRTYLVEPPVHLPRLIHELNRVGVPISEQRFEDRDQVRAIGAAAVVNCTGMGARELFKDRTVIPTRGQLVHVEPQEISYLLSHSGYLFSRRDAIVLGGSVERGEAEATVDPGRCLEILSRHRRFFRS